MKSHKMQRNYIINVAERGRWATVDDKRGLPTVEETVKELATVEGSWRKLTNRAEKEGGRPTVEER